MSHLIVGDGHFCGAPGEADGWARLLQAAQAAGVREVSILGDFLELWIGLRGLDAAWQEPLLAPLRELKAAGVTLRYVWGNKDFFIDDWNRRAELFDVVTDRLRLETSTGPLYLEHGDLVNRADRQYRLWRALSRSGPFSLLARALPRRWLARAAERAAEKMRATNRYHKSYFPEDQLRARARVLPPGPATLVFGHFHLHRELTEGDKKIISLPFLGGEGAGIWLDAAGARKFTADSPPA
jgi:UDP-2,3-diacylglucosamine hydrolase